jgi:hypothetical protein
MGISFADVLPNRHFLGYRYCRTADINSVATWPQQWMPLHYRLIKTMSLESVSHTWPRRTPSGYQHILVSQRSAGIAPYCRSSVLANAHAPDPPAFRVRNLLR